MADFWDVIADQINELRGAASAADVVRILATERNPYGDPSITSAPAFFAGSGGDAGVMDSLLSAGWQVTWAEASYHFAMRAPNGDVITYVEGDVYPENQKPLPHN